MSVISRWVFLSCMLVYASYQLGLGGDASTFQVCTLAAFAFVLPLGFLWEFCMMAIAMQAEEAEKKKLEKVP